MSCKVETGAADRSYTLKHGILLPPFDKGWSRNIDPIPALFFESIEHSNQSLRLRIWQRLEQHAVDDTEHRGVRPDTEREREHGHGGEAGVLQQLAEGEFEIIHSAKSPLDRLSSRGERANSRREARLYLERQQL